MTPTCLTVVFINVEKRKRRSTAVVGVDHFKKSQTMKLSTPTPRRVKFKLYFDCGQLLFGLIGVLKYVKTSILFSVIFPRTDLCKEPFCLSWLSLRRQPWNKGTDIFSQHPIQPPWSCVVQQLVSVSSSWSCRSVSHPPRSSQQTPGGRKAGGRRYTVETNRDSRVDEGLVVCQEQHALILQWTCEEVDKDEISTDVLLDILQKCPKIPP